MSGTYGTLLQYLYREPLGFCRYFAGPAWCPWLPPRPESNDHKLKLNWEVFISGTSITQLHFYITPIVWQCCRVSSPSPLFPDFYLHCPVAGKAAAKRNAMSGFLHQNFNLDKDEKRFLLKTQTHTPFLVRSHHAGQHLRAALPERNWSFLQQEVSLKDRKPNIEKLQIFVGSGLEY